MEPNLAISVRRARPDDAVALATLVNRAYEVEGFFVDGDRTDATEIERLVRDGTFLVLERSSDGGSALAAAVYVDSRNGAGYIGMLSVDPDLQGLGLGTRLVRIAEAMCEAMGHASVSLRIINLREELSRWYKSLGYSEVGTSPYEHRSLKRPAHFVEMHKRLAAQAPSLVAAAAIA